MQSNNVNEPSKFILYLDANNLYGCVVSQDLPYNEFKWLNKTEIDKLLLNLIGCNFIEENSSNGKILEIDLEYPDTLH